MDGQILPLIFHQTQLALGTRATLVSKRIPVPFRVVELGMFYEVGTEFLLCYKWFVSTNASAPTAAEPSDQLLMQALGEQHHFVGEGAYQRVTVGVDVPRRNQYLKVHMLNNSTENAYAVSAVCSIQQIEGGSD